MVFSKKGRSTGKGEYRSGMTTASKTSTKASSGSFAYLERRDRIERALSETGKAMGLFQGKTSSVTRKK